MNMVRLMSLMCALLGGVFLATAMPGVADARGRHSRRKHRARKEARRLFGKAQVHYRLGRFGRARKLYEKAYELLPLPGFLYNIAQCFRMEGKYERALFFYKSYLGAQPSAPNRAMVLELMARSEKALVAKRRRRAAAERQRRIAADRLRSQKLALLKARLAAEARERAIRRPFLPPGPQDEPKPLVKKWWFWTAIAGGVVAAVVTGVALGLTAQSSSGHWPSTSLGLLDRRQ